MFNSKKIKELEMRINEMEKQLTSLSLHNKATDEALAKTGEMFNRNTDELKNIYKQIEEVAKRITEKPKTVKKTVKKDA